MSKPVLAVVDDLFFLAKIRGAAEGLSVPARFARTFDEAAKAAGAEPPALLVVDLNLNSADPLDIVRRAKADGALRGVPMVAYLSHIQVDLKKAAEAAGCDTVWPRSKFSENLADLLIKHCRA